MMDRSSPDWLRLRRAINAEIERLRDDLEVPGTQPDMMRGQISALRWVLQVAEPAPPIAEATSTDYSQA